MIPTDDDFEVPAFLRGGSAESIIDDLEKDEDPFDFPTLDDDEDVTDADIGLEPEEPVIEPEEPKPAPAPKPAKPKKESKADKQAKLKKNDTPPSIEPKAEEPQARPGSNSGIIADQLRSIIERIERMEVEKKEIADDIKDIFTEAKSNGYDSKTIRNILKLRKKDKAERDEEETLLHLYMFALGME